MNYIMGKMTEWLKVGGSLTGPLLGANQAQVRILLFLKPKAYNKVKNLHSLRSFGRAETARPF